MKYKGFYKSVNPKPVGDYIQLFISDWNKEHWGLYVYISKDNYEEDIEDIQKLTKELNYRDGDVYHELIDCSESLKEFYKYLSDIGHYTQSDILDTELWEILEEKGDSFFLYFRKLNGSNNRDDIKEAEFITFEDWYEVLETYHPDLYKALDENNGLCCFDIEHFYNCQGFTEIDDQIVLESY